MTVGVENYGLRVPSLKKNVTVIFIVFRVFLKSLQVLCMSVQVFCKSCASPLQVLCASPLRKSFAQVHCASPLRKSFVQALC
jgi:hypothetical protein